MTSPQFDNTLNFKPRLKPKKLAVAVTIGFSLLTLTHSSYAFKPIYDWTSPATMVSDFNSFGMPQTHYGITLHSLRGADYDNPDSKFLIDVNGKKYTFSATSTESIARYNANVDLGGYNGAADHFENADYHCDGEHLLECADRVRILKMLAIYRTKHKNYELARKALGEALHVIQDFYAHSNWADLYLKSLADPDFKMGRIYLEDTYLDDSASFKSSYFYAPELPDKGLKQADSRDKQTCEWSITSQGNIYVSNIFGSKGEKYLTTAYYDDVVGGVSIGYPNTQYKCDHGLTAYTGIAKDYPSSRNHAEARTGAIIASRHFIKSFIKDAIERGVVIGAAAKEDITNTGPVEPNDIIALLGQGKPEVNIGFLVDTTGSMGDTITGVKSAISKVVDDIKAGKKTVSKFTVMSYGDPGIGEVRIADNIDDMSAYTNSITLGIPDGGGDCPERTTKALAETLKVTPNNTSLFVYTDASTHESELASEIINTARSKSIGVNFFVSGDCGGYDGNSAVYEQIAKATGGMVALYEHSVAGAEGTFAQINPVFKGNLQSGFTIKGVLTTPTGGRSAARTATSIAQSPKLANIGTYTAPDGNASNVILPETPEQKAARLGQIGNAKNAAARGEAAKLASVSVEQTVKVDSSATSMVLTVDMSPLGVVKLFRPDGTEVLATDTGVSINESSVNKTFSIDTPVAGDWKVSVEGIEGTEYEISAKMNSDVSLISFNFVEAKGRAGHEGMFPLPGQPPAGGKQPVVAVVGGDVDTAELVIAALDGSELGKVVLESEGGELGAKKFSGEITLPTQDFRVYLRGKDKTGKDYQRMHDTIYRGQSVRVDAKIGEYDATPGRSVKASFTVKNTGISDTFVLSATNSQGYPVTLSDSEFTVDTDTSNVVGATIDIPADAVAGTEFTVTLQAQSKTNAGSANTATTGFVVNADTDKDGISDSAEKRGIENDTAYDGNKDGTPDWQQANVGSIFAQDGSFITLELSAGKFSKLRMVSDPSNGEEKLDKATFPMGYVDFSITDIPPAGESVLKIHYPSRVKPSKYYKFGPTTASATPIWYEYADTKLEPGLATITLKDGKEGDDDLTENGVIVDAGGLGIIPNARPLAQSDSLTTTMNKAATTGNVLTNDSDPDGDTFTLTEVDPVSYKGGTVVNNGDGTFTYTPTKDYVGEDNFVYTITDAKGAISRAAVMVNIQTDGRGDGSGSNNASGGGGMGILGLSALFSLLVARRFRRKQSI